MHDPALLHVYAQPAWHDPVRIVGNRAGLIALAYAIASALADDQGTDESFTADGEAFPLIVQQDDTPWDGPTWPRRRLPYTDELARDGRDAAILPDLDAS